MSAAVREYPALRVVGTDSRRAWRVPGSAATDLSLAELRGIVRHDVADQIVVVRPGTRLTDLQQTLASHGQSLPLDPTEASGTVGGALSLNLPHRHEARYGAWRDWVLGLQAVTADGKVVRAGSQVVKNVAGYDVHKLFVGARGALGILTEVTFRTYPQTSLRPAPLVRRGDAFETGTVQRVRRTDFAEAITRYPHVEGDPESGTLWLPADTPLHRFPHDWILRQGHLDLNATQVRLMQRTKQLFDPDGRLNPGEWGFA